MTLLPYPSRHSIETLGFTILPGVVRTDEIAKLVASFSNLDHRCGRAGIRHLLNHPATNAVANDPRLLEIARAILGEAALPFRATLFDKSPDSNWLIA